MRIRAPFPGPSRGAAVVVGVIVALVQPAARLVALEPVAGDATAGESGTDGIPSTVGVPRDRRDLFAPRPAVALSADELRRGLEPVAGGDAELLPPDKDPTGANRVTVRGGFRLRGRWQPGGALRIMPDDFQPFAITLWRGREGVEFQAWTQGPNRPPAVFQAWAATLVTRAEEDAAPLTRALAAGDFGRAWRASPSVPAPFEIAWDGTRLVLSVADVRLLDVPFAGVPEAIDARFERPMALRELAQVSALIAPARPAAPVKPVEIEPAACTWLEQLPAGTGLAKGAGGGVELRAEQAAGTAQVATALPAGGLAAIVVELENVAPGTGLFLGDAQGRPAFGIGFYGEPEKPFMIVRSPLGSSAVQKEPWPAGWGPPAHVARRVWLRLLPAAGTIRCQVSADGHTWAQLLEPRSLPPKPWSTLGLSCLPGQPAATIGLRRIRIEPLPALGGLAPGALVQAAARLPEIADWKLDAAAWLAQVTARRPADADPDDWRRACTLVRLGAGTDDSFGAALVSGLITDGLRRSRTPAEMLGLLDEAVELLPTTTPATAARAAGWYARVGEVLRQRGDARPYTTVADAVAAAPIWSTFAYDHVPEPLLRAEILALATEQHWELLHDLCRRVRSTLQGRPMPLVAWGADLAAWALEMGSGDEPLPWTASRFVPLTHDVARNATAEVAGWEAAVAGKSFPDAFRALAAIGPFALHELVPDAADARRLVTWPTVLDDAWRRDPGLPEALRTDAPPLAAALVARALETADTRGVELAAVHAFGTPEAARAHLWLGDRHLLRGEPLQALGRYRRSRSTADAKLDVRVAASACLAAAMLGREPGPVPAAGLETAAGRLDAAALESLAAETRRLNPAPAPEPPPAAAPAAGGCDVVDHGGCPPRGGFPLPEEFARRGIDGAARECAVTIDGPRLIVSDRRQALAYDRASGKLLWEALAGSDPNRPEDLAPRPGSLLGLASLRPLVVQGRVYVRRLTQAGPMLVCLDAATGRTLWVGGVDRDTTIVSDPVFVEGRIRAVVLTVPAENQGLLALVSLEPASGGLLDTRYLGRFQAVEKNRAGWLDDRRDFAILPLDDTLVVVGCGAVICCDLAGTPRWIRQQLHVPPGVDPGWIDVAAQPPLLAGDRLLVTQPGSWSVDCLDPTSGRLLWSRTLPDLRRLVGVVDERVIVALDEGFLALAAENGAERWRLATGPRLAGEFCGGPGGLVYAVAEPVATERTARPCLVWVDPENGLPSGRWPLDTLRHPRPLLGLLGAEEGRLWALAGNAQAPQRQLVTLLPTGAAALPPRDAVDPFTLELPPPR